MHNVGAGDGADGLVFVSEIGGNRLSRAGSAPRIAADKPERLIPGDEKFDEFVANRSPCSEDGGHSDPAFRAFWFQFNGMVRISYLRPICPQPTSRHSENSAAIGLEPLGLSINEVLCSETRLVVRAGAQRLFLSLSPRWGAGR